MECFHEGVLTELCLYIPADVKEMEQMIEGMMKFGMCYADAVANIKSRKDEFKKALSKYEREKKKELAATRPSRQKKTNQDNKC